MYRLVQPTGTLTHGPGAYRGRAYETAGSDPGFSGIPAGSYQGQRQQIAAHNTNRPCRRFGCRQVYNPVMKTCCSFTPWIIWNIPPVSVIPAGILSTGTPAGRIAAVQGMNDYWFTGCTGPDPPPGETHRYQFRVYGLDAMLDLPPNSTKHELVAAMRGHVLPYGGIVTICTR